MITKLQVLNFSDYNTLLSRLYTDDFFREIFFRNPAALLENFNLSDVERDSLSKLDPKAVDSFAHTLTNKMERFIQSSFQNLYKHFKVEMRALFAKGYPFIRKSNQDSLQSYAVRMGYFFLEMIPQTNLPPYCIDLAAYYTARLEAKVQAIPEFKIESAKSASDKYPHLYPNLQVHTFSYDIMTLFNETKTKKELDQLARGSYNFLIYYRGENYQIMKLSPSTSLLLKLFNGVYDLKTICQKVNKTYALELEQLIEQVIPELIRNQLVYLK